MELTSTEVGKTRNGTGLDGKSRTSVFNMLTLKHLLDFEVKM